MQKISQVPETRERNDVHAKAVRALLTLVPEGAFCVYDTQDAFGRKSGVFKDAIVYST